MSASASSLPTTTTAATASSSKSRRRSVYIAVVALLIFGAVLGITLGVTLGGNNKNGNTNTSLTASAVETSDNANDENQDDNESPSAAVDTVSPAPVPTPSLTSDSDSDNMTLEPSPSPESSESASTAAAQIETSPPTSSDPPASSGSAALTTAPTAGPTTGPTAGPTTAPSISTLPTPSPTTQEPTPTPSPTTQEPTVQEPQDEECGELVLGTIAIANGKTHVDYYRCHTTTIPYRQADFRNVSIVLLHGGSFSKEDWLNKGKEDWLNKGILDELCANARTVIALNLSTSANREELKDVLKKLSETSSPAACNNKKNDDNKLLNLPVDFLVTPSDSGHAIVDWMMNGNVTEMADYFRTWVPVATGSLTKASYDEIPALSNVLGFDILAIYGNEDTAGEKYSNRLGDLAGATVVYLQSWKDFAQTILDYVFSSSSPSSSPA